MEEAYTTEQASQHALAWCAKNPAWIRICDMPNSDVYYVQWDELSQRQKEQWGTEYGYNEFAIKRCKVKTGFISGKGEFFPEATDVPRFHNLMMVFRVGVVEARALRLAAEAKQAQAAS